MPSPATDGTVDKPFASLSAALSKAKDDGIDPGVILVSSGSFAESGPLELVKGVSVSIEERSLRIIVTFEDPDLLVVTTIER